MFLKPSVELGICADVQYSMLQNRIPLFPPFPSAMQVFHIPEKTKKKNQKKNQPGAPAQNGVRRSEQTSRNNSQQLALS